MPAELPERVAAATGAETVDFPWSQAGVLVAALEDAASTLNTQMWLRPDMVSTIADWQGTFRDEFDEAYGRLVGVAPDLVESSSSRASSVVAQAEDTNAEQRLANDRASELVPTGAAET